VSSPGQPAPKSAWAQTPEVATPVVATAGDDTWAAVHLLHRRPVPGRAPARRGEGWLRQWLASRRDW